MGSPELFFLHIKKSAGQAVRQMLAPHYVIVDKRKRPFTFIQADSVEYNDILNNFRVPLGQYQFSRALFAKTFLFPESWHGLCSFAFSREPQQRCVSAFHYIYWRGEGASDHVRNVARNWGYHRHLKWTARSGFDFFLGAVEESQNSDTNAGPLGLHFSTHTARMWNDVTDANGEILLRYVFRLESLVPGLNQVFSDCGIDRRLESAGPPVNKSDRRQLYRPTAAQRTKVESIYANDFELYETALVLH